MLQTTYEVTQSGNTISCDKIIINKYENKVTKLHFTYDDTMQGTRKYVALLNPITNRYHIYPIGLDETVTLSTEMSCFPGIWQMILIATSDDYEIEDDNIDNSKLCYVSNTLKRMIVRDNFLSEDAIEYEENPAIQQLIDETVAMRDTLEAYALGANEDYLKASEAATTATAAAEETSLSVAQFNELVAQASSILQENQEVSANLTNNGDGTKYLADDGNYYTIKTEIEETDFDTMLEEVFA